MNSLIQQKQQTKNNALKPTTEHRTKDNEVPPPFQKGTKTTRSPVRGTEINSEMEVIIVETPKTIAASTRECYSTPRSTPIDNFFPIMPTTDVRAELGTQQDMERSTSTTAAQPVAAAALIQPQTVTQQPQLMKVRLMSLGREIDELQKFCTSQRNMHKDVIRRCSTIKRLHTETMLQMDKEERQRRLDQNNTPTQEMKAHLAERLVEITQSAKRVRTKPSPKEAGKSKSPAAKKQKSLGAETKIIPSIRDEKEEWTKVRTKSTSTLTLRRQYRAYLRKTHRCR